MQKRRLAQRKFFNYIGKPGRSPAVAGPGFAKLQQRVFYLGRI